LAYNCGVSDKKGGIARHEDERRPGSFGKDRVKAKGVHLCFGVEKKEKPRRKA